MLNELCNGVFDKNKKACDMLKELENEAQEGTKQNATQSLNTQKEQIIKDLYAAYFPNNKSSLRLLDLLSKESKTLWDKAENNDDGTI